MFGSSFFYAFRNAGWRVIQALYGFIKFEFIWLPINASGLFILDPSSAFLLFPVSLIAGTLYNIACVPYHIFTGFYKDIKALLQRRPVKKITGFKNTPWRNDIIKV